MSDTQSVVRRLSDGLEFAKQQVSEHPWRSLAISLGAGYVVGGGLTTKLTGRMVGAGFRIAARMVTVPLLVQAATHLLLNQPNHNQRTN